VETHPFRLVPAATAAAPVVFGAVADERKPSRFCTDGGLRHGVSFFPHMNSGARRGGRSIRPPRARIARWQ